MAAYVRVLDYLLDHGSITTEQARNELDMDATIFRGAVSTLRKILLIKSEVIDDKTHTRRHILDREPRACVS